MNQYYIQFFTATNLWWKKLLQPDKYKQIIIDSLQFLVENERVKVYGFVIMPNHIHIIWKINQNHKLDDVQRDFLKYTAQMIKFDLTKNHPQVLPHFEVNLKDRKYQFWERNPLSVDLYSREVVYQKLCYIHANPLQEKWKLANIPEEYWFSSARYYEWGIDDFGFLTHYLEDC
jgi:putative transposase